MKKRMLLLCLLCAALLLAGCSQQCDHQLTVSVTKEASCMEPGQAAYTCAKCGAAFTAELPITAHTYGEPVLTPATCTQKGMLLYTCTVCGEPKTELTPEADHQFDPYALNFSRCTLCGQDIAGGGRDTANPWNEKLWVALGTSLTSQEQGKYVHPLVERSGMTAFNFGVPGAVAGGHVLYHAQTAAELETADLVTVEFGVNDWFANYPLGNVGDTTPYLYSLDDLAWNNGGAEGGTFAGACYQVFSAIQSKAPGAVVVFLTDPTGQDSGGTSCQRQSVNHVGLRQRDYTEMAIEVAEYMGIRVIDAGAMSQIHQSHPQYLADQIHHTDLGGQQYALTVWLELKNIAPLLKSE